MVKKNKFRIMEKIFFLKAYVYFLQALQSLNPKFLKHELLKFVKNELSKLLKNKLSKPLKHELLKPLKIQT